LVFANAPRKIVMSVDDGLRGEDPDRAGQVGVGGGGWLLGVRRRGDEKAKRGTSDSGGHVGILGAQKPKSERRRADRKGRTFCTALLRREPSLSYTQRRLLRSSQRHDRYLRKRSQPEWDPPIARSRIDVEQRVAGAMASHRMLEKWRREAPAEPRQRQLAPVRVSAQRQRNAPFGEPGPERGIVREGNDGRRRRDVRECALDVRRGALVRHLSPPRARGGIASADDRQP